MRCYLYRNENEESHLLYGPNAECDHDSLSKCITKDKNEDEHYKRKKTLKRKTYKHNGFIALCDLRGSSQFFL